MNSFFRKVQNKLEEAKISDTNYKLGQIKENLVADFNNLREEAANYGSLIKSESSNKISKLWAGSSSSSGSTSLPKSHTIGALSSISDSKYKYKSSIEDNLISEESKKIDENLEDLFIKVVESKEEQKKSTRTFTTREEIRAKLAFGGNEESKPKKDDLQICFINEVVSDEDEEEEIEEEEEDSSEDCSFPKSKSHFDQLRNPNLSFPTPEEEDRREKQLKKKLNQLQKELQISLLDCKDIAKNILAKEKRKRIEEDPLKKLLPNCQIEKLGQKEYLEELNIASLQVLVNHRLEDIQRLNGELVDELLKKDELTIEQESQLIDVEDLSHSLSRC